MSITNQQIIDRAGFELGLVESGDSMDSTDTADALIDLNQMMAAWAVKDKDFKWPPQDTAGDVAPIPIWAEQGVISNLAVTMGPTFRSPIPADLHEKARLGRQTIGNTLVNLELEGSDMTHLPQGRNWYYDIVTGQSR